MRFLPALCLLASLLPASAVQEAAVSSLKEWQDGEFNGTQASSAGLAAGLKPRSLGPVMEPMITALLPDGDRLFVGTGSEGRLYLHEKGELTLLADTEEAMVSALAREGRTLYVGTGSPARLHRWDGKTLTVLWTGEEAYLHALALWNGALYIATGSPARLYRWKDGEAVLALSLEQDAITALAVDDEGLWAGTWGSGWVLKIKKDHTYSIVHRDELPQITALAPGERGVMYFLSGNFPKEGKDPKGALSVVGKIEGGRVAVLRQYETTLMSALGYSPRLGGLLWGGTDGKLFTHAEGRTALFAQVPQQQVAFISGEVVATLSACELFRLEPAAEGEYLPRVFDAKRDARWGGLTWRGEGGVTVAVRFGDQEKPDAAWGPFSAPCAEKTCPFEGAGRYGQARFVLVPGARVEAFQWVYRPRNVPPEIRSFTALEPGEIFLKAGSGPDTAVVEAASPDKYGIFTTVEGAPPEAKDKSGQKKYFRKGYRTLVWEVADADGDEVEYDLHFQPTASDGWLPVFEGEKHTAFSLDTQALPDGWFRFRLTARDRPDREEAREFSPLVQVDNRPPSIAFASDGRRGWRVTVADAGSRLWKVEASFDAEKWEPLEPEDGLLDSAEETFLLPAARAKDRTFIVVRAADRFYNFAAASPGR
jgi:hypothetical protein